MGGDGTVLFGGTNPAHHQLVTFIQQDPYERRTDDSLADFKPLMDSVRQVGRDSLQW